MKTRLVISILAALTLSSPAKASLVKWDNGELYPIPKGEYSITTTGPTEASFGPNVWMHVNGIEWKKTSDGTDLFHWNANIFYRYFDNSRYEFYYFTSGNNHKEDYPKNPGSVPLPAPVWLLGTGLIGLAGIRRKRLMEY